MLNLFIIAGIMAVFGIYGFRRGFWSMLVSLGVLFFAILLIVRAPQQLVRYLNAIYVSTILLFKGGLTAIVSGDLDAAKQLISSIEKPFAGEKEKWALLIVLLGAVVVGLLIGLLFKKKPSFWGLLLGLIYGFLLAMGLILLLFGTPAAVVVPTGGVAGEVAQGSCAGLLGQLVCALNNPASSALCGSLLVFGIVVFVIVVSLLSTRGAGKKGRKNERAEE